ncbi:MAG TPA: YceI family protein [Sunxiuqinia sp.]|nr:YceI family protein [Sunxiuqinia sp.]
MKITLLNLILALFVSTAALGQMSAEGVHFNQYMFDDIQIVGKTNVNDFHMRYRETQFCKVTAKQQSGNAMLGIEIPAKEVQADSKMMLHDFLDLIHAQKYPTINIEIRHNDIESSLSNPVSKKEIELTMNGVSKQFQCETYSENCYGDQHCLIGKLKIKLTDFGINPPHKFFGLVKVKDEIFINFRILFS